jgi:hypothetical protein
LETLEQKIKINFIKNGLWLGLILVGFSVLSFYIITMVTKSPIIFVVAPIIFSFALPIIVVLIFCFYGRKKIGGYWTFKQATTGIFIMFCCAYVVQTVGRDLIFARVIEPHMVDKTEKAYLAASAIIRAQPGTNQKQLDANQAEVKKNFDEQKNLTVGMFIQGVLFSIIFIFVLALIFGALFKREAPVYPA